MPHAACSPAKDDLPASSSGSLAPSDVDSIPAASTPRDTEVLSQRIPDSAPEPAVVPESGERPLRKKGKTVAPAASVQPEAPDNLLEALNGASIKEEHRTVMSAVIQKVQLTKSGLTYSSLLTGFEVRNLKYVM